MHSSLTKSDETLSKQVIKLILFQESRNRESDFRKSFYRMPFISSSLKSDLGHQGP